MSNIYLQFIVLNSSNITLRKRVKSTFSVNTKIRGFGKIVYS